MTSEHDAATSPPLPPAGAPEPVTPPPRPWRIKWIVLLVVVTGVVGLDQVTKSWAQDVLQRDLDQRVTVIDGYLALSYVRNPGAAWGFLARSSESFRRPFFLAVSVVAMGFILYLFLRLERGQRLLLAALCLVMGGAIGNFIDRLRYSYVIDFIDFHVEREFKWPTFNIADVAITVGVMFLFAEMFILPFVRRRRAMTAPAQRYPTAPGETPAPQPEDETGATDRPETP
jgi:signal peptidase II